MRKIACVLLAVLLIGMLSLNASAKSGASSVSIYATVSSDETCQVTMTALLHLDQPVAKLKIPVPLQAESITLNGSRVRTSKTDTSQLVDISGIAGNIAGDFSVTLTYSLHNVVEPNEDGLLILRLPMLSGFAYPIDALDFSVTMPGPLEVKPAFSSGYHQSDIEKDLTCQVSGAMITGASVNELKDHETLEMLVTVPEEMFPQTGITLPDYKLMNILMLVSAVLALAYWLIFLRCRLPRRVKTAVPPEGYSAGQLGSILHMHGADLTMMVFTWAQLGYLRIRTDRKGNVLLQKCMEMGNERSGFELRCFRSLFARRNTVDTSSLDYVAQWQKAAKLPPNMQSLLHPRSGNTKLFRVLASLIGLFGGISLGIALGVGAVLQLLLAILFAVLGIISCWHIQRWATCLFLHSKGKLWVSLGLCAVWVLLCSLSGIAGTGVLVILSQLLAGLLASYGGRRTEAGMHAISEVLGLRRYLRTISRTELQRICQSNPDYFHTMAPYALSLGVDKAFAKRFGDRKLPDCLYMTTGKDAQLTAAQWSLRMRQVARVMDDRRKKMWIEKIMGLLPAPRK